MVLDFLKIKNINMEITRTVDTLGNIHYENEDGLHHRENGPAIITYDGTKMWYINGKLHREDGPAYENYNSYNAWWINGERHREDGPAIEYADGNKIWYLNAKELTEQEFNDLLLRKRLQRIIEL
jgi:hypothetical protein